MDPSPANAPDDYELFICLFSRNQGRILAFVRALVPDATQAFDQPTGLPVGAPRKPPR